jgi:hypothetical protein
MNLKSLFVKEDGIDKAKVKEEVKPSPQPKVVAFGGTAGAMQQIQAVGATGNYEQTINEELHKVDQPGLDFLEFTDAVNELNGQPLSELQKYQVTFPTYLKSGVTKDKLVESGKKYLEVLNHLATDFEASLQNEQNTSVQTKRELAAEILKKNEELSRQMQENAAKAQQLTVDANTAENQLATEAQAFNIALNNKRAVLESHINNIQTFLK